VRSSGCGYSFEYGDVYRGLAAQSHMLRDRHRLTILFAACFTGID
jgi:hypothetical protein